MNKYFAFLLVLLPSFAFAITPTPTPRATNTKMPDPVKIENRVELYGQSTANGFYGKIFVNASFRGLPPAPTSKLYLDEVLLKTFNDIFYSTTLDSTKLTNGTHKFKLISTIGDASGSSEVTFKVFNEAPREPTNTPTALPDPIRTVPPVNTIKPLPTVATERTPQVVQTTIVKDDSERHLTVVALNRKTKEPIPRARVVFIQSRGNSIVKTDEFGVSRVALQAGSEVIVTVKAKGFVTATTKMIKLTQDSLIPIKIRKKQATSEQNSK